MNDHREQFEGVLEEFSRLTGRELRLDEHNGCSFLVSGDACEMTYLPESDHILLWMVLGRMGDDANAGPRARRLLELNDGWQGSGGGTFMLDPEARLVTLADRRSAVAIASADHLAAWINALHTAYVSALDAMEFDYPYVDDDPPEDKVDDERLIREILTPTENEKGADDASDR